MLYATEGNKGFFRSEIDELSVFIGRKNKGKVKGTNICNTACCVNPKISNMMSSHPPFFPFHKLLVRYCSDHHGDKLFHDAVAIEPIVMLHLCTLFIFSL